MNERECIKERNLALQEIYKRIRKSHVNMNLLSRDMIVSIILEQPAPRFYITPDRAKSIILSHYNNGQGKMRQFNKRPQTRELIDDLVANYERLKAQFPHTPDERLYEMVVEQPAKSFFMTHHRVKEVIFNYTGRNHK